MRRIERFLAVNMAILVSAVIGGELRCLAAAAPSSSVKRENLVQLARAARGQFTPPSAGDVQRAREELEAATTRLGAMLAGAPKDKAEKWKGNEYLRWDELQAQLKPGTTPDAALLAAIAARCRDREVEGFELPEFVSLRAALTRYANASLFAGETEAKTDYEKRVADLATRLEAYGQKPSAEEAIEIGRHLGWLEDRGQAKALVAAVRAQHWRPNLLAQFSEEMLNAGIANDVDREVSIQEVILGTSVFGTGRMTGRVTLDLVPDEARGAMDLRLTGETVSDNVGYNGPVTICSRGVTTIDARKRVLVDALGTSSEPPQACCCTETDIQGICARCNLVRKMAWKRAMRLKGQAEQIASQRAAIRVEAMMEEESRAPLQDIETRFQERFRQPLVRRDGFPRLFQTATSGERLFVTALSAAGDQLAASTEPPPFTAPHAMSVQIHESLVGNLSHALWRGNVLTDEQLRELVENLTGKVPEELQRGEDDEPWSLTFADERPLETRFDDQRFTVRIHTTQFTRGETDSKKPRDVLPEPCAISATYQVEKTAQGMRLTRQGDVEVILKRYTGKLSLRQISWRSFIKKNFEKMFQAGPRETEGLALRGRWEKAGKYPLEQLVCDDGWLVLGWKQPARATEPAKQP